MEWRAFIAAEVAEAASLLDKLLVPVLSTLAVLGAGALTLIGTFRTSGRAAQVQRDAQLDQRADQQYRDSQAEVVRLTALVQQRETERDEARSERDDYRERWVTLRIDVRSAGHDPDNINAEKGGRRAEQ